MQLLGKGLPCSCDIHLTDSNNLHCKTSGITDIQLAHQRRRHIPMAKSRHWKRKNSTTRSCITNKISRNKSITDRNR